MSTGSAGPSGRLALSGRRHALWLRQDMRRNERRQVDGMKAGRMRRGIGGRVGKMSCIGMSAGGHVDRMCRAEDGDRDSWSRHATAVWPVPTCRVIGGGRRMGWTRQRRGGCCRVGTSVGVGSGQRRRSLRRSDPSHRCTSTWMLQVSIVVSRHFCFKDVRTTT